MQLRTYLRPDLFLSGQTTIFGIVGSYLTSETEKRVQLVVYLKMTERLYRKHPSVTCPVFFSVRIVEFLQCMASAEFLHALFFNKFVAFSLQNLKLCPSCA